MLFSTGRSAHPVVGLDPRADASEAGVGQRRSDAKASKSEDDARVEAKLRVRSDQRPGDLGGVRGCRSVADGGRLGRDQRKNSRVVFPTHHLQT